MNQSCRWRIKFSVFGGRGGGNRRCRQGWGAELLGVKLKEGEKALWPWGVQEFLMFLICLAAYFTTSGKNREANKFTFGPIIEVAVLFIGIFITMAPALLILNAWGNGDRADLGKFGIVSCGSIFGRLGYSPAFSITLLPTSPLLQPPGTTWHR